MLVGGMLGETVKEESVSKILLRNFGMSLETLWAEHTLAHELSSRRWTCR